MARGTIISTAVERRQANQLPRQVGNTRPGRQAQTPQQDLHNKHEAETLLTAEAEGGQRRDLCGCQQGDTRRLPGALAGSNGPNMGRIDTIAHAAIVRHRIVPELGTVPLAQLDAISSKASMQLNKRYTPGTVRVTHAVLDAALARAVKWRLIPRNPADDAILPAIPRPTAVVWSGRRVRRIPWGRAVTTALRRYGNSRWTAACGSERSWYSAGETWHSTETSLP